MAISNETVINLLLFLLFTLCQCSDRLMIVRGIFSPHIHIVSGSIIFYCVAIRVHNILSDFSHLLYFHFSVNNSKKNTETSCVNGMQFQKKNLLND